MNIYFAEYVHFRHSKYFIVLNITDKHRRGCGNIKGWQKSNFNKLNFIFIKWNFFARHSLKWINIHYWIPKKCIIFRMRIRQSKDNKCSSRCIKMYTLLKCKKKKISIPDARNNTRSVLITNAKDEHLLTDMMCVSI